MVVVDANTLAEAVNNGTLEAGTFDAPTSLGAWTTSDKYIFMIADGDYVTNDQGKSELTIQCAANSVIRWSMTNPSADYTYNCLLYNFTSNDGGQQVITQPTANLSPLLYYNYNPANPSQPSQNASLITTWVATALNPGSVQYSWSFMLIDTATGSAIGYMSWDPFINVTAS
ncbi:AidA/PixA family protein [Azospirillum sp. B4]|uniref:AidA/PixA family protein n=1 Tax=Azospirillum sp. B4 TaxID=95605 RepID=UPI0003453DDE|nr:AidA/PixA family protein [Azospirillum sp. B4]